MTADQVDEVLKKLHPEIVGVVQQIKQVKGPLDKCGRAVLAATNVFSKNEKNMQNVQQTYANTKKTIEDPQTTPENKKQAEDLIKQIQDGHDSRVNQLAGAHENLFNLRSEMVDAQGNIITLLETRISQLEGINALIQRKYQIQAEELKSLRDAAVESKAADDAAEAEKVVETAEKTDEVAEKVENP
ncbi:MAG: hypothetical protein CMK92_04560 [Pseudomonas sp.]|nr:hypothetical protein [Pseudomonas sp.]